MKKERKQLTPEEKENALKRALRQLGIDGDRAESVLDGLAYGSKTKKQKPPKVQIDSKAKERHESVVIAPNRKNLFEAFDLGLDGDAA